MKRQTIYPNFIYIAGCDGTGKSTQVKLLLDRLCNMGVYASHRWLRFPFLFSVPLLAYARWKGYSWRETKGQVRYGYWYFTKSWLLRNLFPIILWVDAAFAALLKIYLPLLVGRTIVCERFVLDILVDLMVATGRADLAISKFGKWYIHLIPKKSSVIILDLEADVIRARRSALHFDRNLERRLEAFRQLAQNYGFTIISSASPVEKVEVSILERITRENGTH